MCNTKSPYLATFVLFWLLFQSACNRETSSKCKRGSFLQILPKTADVTTPSFTGCACQDSDSLPFSLSPPSPPSPVIDQAATQEEEGEGGELTLGRGREGLRHTSAPRPLLLSLLPRCLLVSQQRFTTCEEEEGSEPHSWQDTRQAFSGKISEGGVGKRRKNES